MLRGIFSGLTGLVGVGALIICAATSGWTYDIKPKTADSAFSGKSAPDIVGLTSDTDGSKASPIFEAYLKDLPGVTPQANQIKFGNTGITYVTSMSFNSPAADKKPAESLMATFSSPASGNRAFYITRELGFAQDKQPSKAEMIERVTKKYGSPTVMGDGHIFYFYKGGRIVSVKAKYDSTSALAALEAPLDPKAAVALNDSNGRGSCVAILKREQAMDKTLAKMADEAAGANCDGIVDVVLSPGIAADRVGKADFTLIDLKRIVSAAKIDSDAFAAEKNESVTT
jgi:hypothetical protein